MKVHSLSPTSLELYHSCPYCFYLKYTGHPQETTEAMKFGIRLHSAVANYHKHGLFEFDEDLQDYLDLYMQEYTRDFQVCEEMWELPLFDTGITFKLKMDLIASDLLIEHKTSARPYSQAYVDMMRQLTAYSWAWGQLYQQREKGIKVNVFIKEPKDDEALLQTLETTRSAADFRDWEAWAKEIVTGIEADYFEPNEKGRYHNYSACQFYKEVQT